MPVAAPGSLLVWYPSQIVEKRSGGRHPRLAGDEVPENGACAGEAPTLSTVGASLLASEASFASKLAPTGMGDGR